MRASKLSSRAMVEIGCDMISHLAGKEMTTSCCTLSVGKELRLDHSREVELHNLHQGILQSSPKSYLGRKYPEHNILTNENIL